MIEKIECVMLECDNCKDVFEDTSGFSIFIDESSVIERASDSEWNMDTEKHFCPLCHSIDDKDEIIIDESRKDLHAPKS